jgi:hypothetical protein
MMVWAVWLGVVGRCWLAGVGVCAGDHYGNHTHTHTHPKNQDVPLAFANK